MRGSLTHKGQEFERTRKHQRFMWDDQKDAALKWMYLMERKTYAEIMAELGCTQSQLLRRLKVLDIYRTRSRFWTSARDSILRDKYLKEDNAALAERIGCAQNYVADRLTYLGLERPYSWKNAMEGQE
jgi:hypothetical protein